MPLGQNHAEIISCPGRLGDMSYLALEIGIEGFESPYVLTMALPAIGARALAEQIEPVKLYEAIAQTINRSQAKVPLPANASAS